MKTIKIPLKELSKIVEKTIIEINKALKIFDLCIKEMQSTNEFDIDYINKLKQNEYNNIISKICKTNNINENHIRKIGGWPLPSFN
jgi:predicted transcriptional regulator